jgi:predicted extracellular nuclease
MSEKRKFIVMVAVIALTLTFLLGTGATYAATSVFVNEIHYDNDSTDADEAIEIAGPANTDLTGWSLVLYNGNGGTVYSTTALSGTITDQQNGFGTLSFAIAGIQNGSPDGLALIDPAPASNVIQFLSYEGTFVAVGGPADGMTSVDIGVAEASTSPLGYSLQLTGTGTMAEDFTWAGSAASTFGAVNTGQTFAGGTPTTPELLLSEIIVTPTAGEFIEIYNPTSSAIDLSDFYLTDATFAGTSSTYYYNIVTGADAGGGSFGDFHARFPDGASIAAGEYQTVALAGSAGFLTEFGAAPTYELFDDGSADGEQLMREALPGSINGQGGLSNDGEVVVLYYWDGASDLVLDMDYAVWGDKAEAVDKTAVSVDGPDADTDPTPYLDDTAVLDQDVVAGGSHATGNSWQRNDLTEGAEITAGGNGVNGEDETSEDLSNTWCENPPTPGEANDCTPPPPPPPPSSGDLFFSEYVEGSSYNKAVEIYNATGAPVDLSAYAVELYSNGAAGSTASAALSGTLADGDVLVMAHGSASAAILAVADLTNNSVINFNGDDAVVLRNNGVVVDIIGQVGFDPGSEWGTGLVSTQDNTIRRLPQICAGDTNELDAFDPALEWDGFATDTFDGLGSHTSNCVTTGQPLPLSEGFDDCTLAGWEIISVDADATNTWACSASNIEVNGYGDAEPANEWLITPALNMNAQENDRLTFRSQTRYTDSGLSYPQLEVLYSTDYNGSGDPAAATWTALTGITFSPENSGVWTDSGEIDLSGISGSNVSFAFHYTASSTSSAARWRVDAINFYERTGPFPYKIHEIQGSGPTSPVVGEQVLIEGVVVGDFQELGELGGFHVQEEDADADADPATSEGIYVYNYSYAVAIGDVVEVIGTVAEYNGLTEISSVSNVTILSSGSSVTPTAVSMPVASLDDLEAYEGMLVTFPQDLYISEYFNFDRYNEIVLTSERLYQPTATFDPGSPEAAALTAANLLSRITLDDGRTGQNVDPARHPNGAEFTTTNTFRGGDILQNVTGVVDYANGLYKIQPTQGAAYVPQNLRAETPDEVGGAIKVASFNVLNYFSTLDDGVNDICGPAQNQECRGADTPEEFQRQRDKIFAALAAIDADVVGLIEIENHVTDAAVQDLVAGLNAYLGSEAYAYIATGPIGTDAIKQAFIYKPASVKAVGSYAILDSSVDSRFLDTKNRPALAQTFYDRFTGGNFTVVVNHLKSKGSACDDVGDPDLGDGAGNCNVTRMLAAQALVDWLATDPTGSGDPDFLIIGDLNSYDKEDPIDAILAGTDDVLGSGDDYTDLLYNFIGENAYSYVFDSQLGYLDHGLANSTLLSQVTGATVWHINADEPDIIDYDMSFKQDAQDALWEPTAYRSSDHDPVVVGLQLEPEGPIVNDNGCYVLGIEGTPYPYAVNLVTTEHRSLKYLDRLSTYLFMAEIWGRTERLPRNTCYEIHGTDTHDIIFGGRADDVIFGYGSRDVLFGKNGDDTFTGGSGRDQFLGDGGYDTVLDREAGERCSSIEEGCPVHGHKDDHRKDH